MFIIGNHLKHILSDKVCTIVGTKEAPFVYNPPHNVNNHPAFQIPEIGENDDYLVHISDRFDDSIGEWIGHYLAVTEDTLRELTDDEMNEYLQSFK